MTNDKEVVDDQTVDEDKTEENEDEELDLEDDSDEDDSEDVEKQLKTLRAQKAHWRKKYEEATENSSSTIKSESKPKVEPDIRQDVESLKLSEKKRQFGHKHELSPEEVDHVFKISDNPTEETLKNPFIKGGLKEIRRRSRQTNNTPKSKSSISSYTGGKKWSDLSKEERKRIHKKRSKEKGWV